MAQAFKTDQKSVDDKTIKTGLIAQEVEEVANQVGFNFDSIRKPVNENDYYALDYSGFVVPLIKAVQELQQMLEERKALIKKRQDLINTLSDRVTVIEKSLN